MSEQQYRLLNAGETIPEGAEYWDKVALKWALSYKVGGGARDTPYRVPLESGWVTDRQPTREDATRNGHVFAMDGGEVTSWEFSNVRGPWHPAPQPIEPEPDAFEEWFARAYPEGKFANSKGLARLAWDAAKEGAK